MAFNFPNSPADGAIFSPGAGLPVYTWSASRGAWERTSGGLSAGVYIGDTAPVNPVNGQLWWNSTTGNTMIWFNDGNSSQWVQFNTGPVSQPVTIPKVTAFTGSGTWTPDPKMLNGYAQGKGGGGGGGGTTVQPSGYYGCAGGGEGTTVTKYFKKADITLASYAVTIGAGGAGVNAGNGTNGGDTTLGSLLTAKGGIGGALYNPGYAPGTGNVGDIIVPGHVGGTGMQGPAASGTIGFGGEGGGPGGSGGTVGGVGGAVSGGTATGPGGGGGGAASNQAGPGGIVGGAGAAGVMYIVEYCTL